MPNTESQLIKRLMQNMNERAKELRCLYSIDDVIKQNSSPEVVLPGIVKVIPSGWQHTTLCEARITYLGNVYATSDFRETPRMMSADIVVDNRTCGRLDVVYLQNELIDKIIGFLPEEKQLLNAICERIGNYLFNRRMRAVLEGMESQNEESTNEHEIQEEHPDIHWRWRRKMMEELAKQMDGGKLGIRAIYLIGSAREQTAGPASDIDLIVHFKGSPAQQDLVRAEVSGWSKCLSFINMEKTGYHTDKLIDIHFITDESIKAKDSFATMILPPMRADLLKSYD